MSDKVTLIALGTRMEKQLGEFEQLVLLALLRLGDDDAYGVKIRQLLERNTGREIALGTIYKTLGRLEEKGYVQASFGEPTAVRGGRRKKFYVVQKDGLQALERSLSALRKLLHGLEGELKWV